MSGITERRDIGAMLNQALAVDTTSITATAVATGEVIDREDHNMPLSMKAVASLGLTIGTDETVQVSYQLQDSADGASFDDYGDPVEGTEYTDADTGTTVVEAADFNLSGCRRYVKIVATVTLSAGSGDEVQFLVVAILEKGDRY